MKVFNRTYISENGDTYHFNAEPIPNSKVFEGHFPNNPIVPGVCTIQLVKECCSDILLRKIKFSEIKEVKFLTAIIPEIHKELELIINLKQNNESINITAQILSGQENVMKLKASIR